MTENKTKRKINDFFDLDICTTQKVNTKISKFKKVGEAEKRSKHE